MYKYCYLLTYIKFCNTVCEYMCVRVVTLPVYCCCEQVCDFTSDPKRIMTFLDELKNCTEVEKCDLSTVFNEM